MIKEIIKYISVLIIFILSAIQGWAKQENDKFTVVIDAGHGGKDIGATDNGVKEKDINLKVAKYLEQLIKKKMKNSKVVMTRDNDTFLTLQQRADAANKAHGDLFISIHTNSVDKRNKNRKTVEGASVYTLGLHKDDNNLEVAMRENSVIELEQDYQQKYSGFDPQRDESYIIFEMAQKQNLSRSIKFAEEVENQLVNAGRVNRGVHQAGFWVLWATSMPAVLIELDFICNPTSAKYISSDKGAKELAEAIFKAVQKYEQTWNKGAVTIPSSDLSDTYDNNTESLLEDSYVTVTNTPVAKAKTRTHKTSSPQTPSRKKGVAGRKRRSLAAKETSGLQSYESPNLVFPKGGEYVASVQSVEPAESSPIAMAETKAVDAKKLEKERKKAEKKLREEQKKAEKEAQKQRKKDAHNAKVNKLITVYKIQILASADLLSQSSSRFCGLSPITAYKENNLYKYYYGESTNRADIEALLSDVKKKIPDAFIVESKKTVQSK